jgi:integrase
MPGHLRLNSRNQNLTIMPRDNFTILNEKLMDRLLQINTKRHKRKSGVTPHARTTIPCVSANQPDPSSPVSLSQLEALRKVSVRLYYVAILLQESGGRISEILAIKHQDILPSGHWILRGSKGSNDRVIGGGLAYQFLLNCKTLKAQVFEDFNRFFVYRQFKKVGIGKVYNNNSITSVTHSFRHELALELKNQNEKQKLTQQTLGQKSINSTKYYHHEKESEQRNQKRNSKSSKR